MMSRDPPHPYVIPAYFHQPEETQALIAVFPSFAVPGNPNLLSVSMDLPVLDISSMNGSVRVPPLKPPNALQVNESHTL